jgi:TalC/MipB family fructose-6-phosphate aldolase
MELFLDTADAQAVKELSETLTIAGVTIITRSGKTLERVIDEMCKTLAPSQKSFFQVIATDFDGILEETRRICALRENAYAKIPVTPVGLKAIKAAKAEGLNVLATAIYSADQAFLAAMNGADYLAPYVNRMCNYGDGVGQVADLVNMLATNGLPSKICAASFKNTEQVHDVICVGAQSVTVAPDIVWTMVKHPGTGIAVDEFNAAWENSFGRRTMFGE